MRDTILEFEREKLVEAVKAGTSWDEAKQLLPDVDPKVLDEGFKEYAHAEAAQRRELEKPAAAPTEAPEVDGEGVELEPAAEQSAPEQAAPAPKKRGRKAKQVPKAEG